MNIKANNLEIPARNAYTRMVCSPVVCEPERTLLAASVVDNSLIESTGQELGPDYDFSSGLDSNTGKTFSHEWESGTI